LNLLRYFFLKTQTAFVPFGFSGLGQRSNVASQSKSSGLSVGVIPPFLTTLQKRIKKIENIVKT
jgi:hypothetical protein